MEDIWTNCANRVLNLSSKPEKFLEPNDLLFEKTKILTKALYDSCKLTEDGEYKNVTLPELLIEGFDEEQVWAGIELQNVVVVKDIAETLNKLSHLAKFAPKDFDLFKGKASEQHKNGDIESEEDDLIYDDDLDDDDLHDDDDLDEDHVEPMEDDEENEDDDDLSELGIEDKEKEDLEGSEDEMAEILNDPDFQHMSDSEGDDLPLFDEKSSEDEELEVVVDEEKEKQKQAEREKKQQILDSKADNYMKAALSNMKSTLKGGDVRKQVEDKFFKLDEMEKFLEAEEAKERQENVKKSKPKLDDDDESDDEDSDMDLFDSRFADQSKEDRVKYGDYFQDEVADEEEFEDNEEDDHQVANNRPPQLQDLFANESDDDNEKDLGEVKSSFEIRTAKLKKEIKTLEASAVSDKPWQMVGEVNAVKRPENSLLQEHLEYDHLAKQAPAITEEVSKRLEDIIVQRIKDKAWDDVERKIKPVENPYEYKKRLILDQEKSKLSLAEVYEQEYLKQKGDLEESKKTPGMLDDLEDGPPPEVEHIKKSMSKLFSKLDALTHFHYTPKAPSADVKIIRNAPTIAMEEVAPIGMSDANLLAPQEIVDKKRGEDIGSTERSETEKKRERRLKKLKQRQKEKEKEKKEKLLEKLKPGLGNKHSKKKVLKDLERAEKEGKIVTIKSKSKAVKSSSAFFNQLQNEAMSAIKDKTGKANQKKKSSGKSLSGANLKL